MSTTTGNIVQKLWSFCNILRDDGITYQAYVTELTYLLFLKMLVETEREDALPAEYRWASLTAREGDTLLLRPVRPTCLSFASEPPADADFLAERPAVIEPGRFDLSDGGGAAPTESGQ